VSKPLKGFKPQLAKIKHEHAKRTTQRLPAKPIKKGGRRLNVPPSKYSTAKQSKTIMKKRPSASSRQGYIQAEFDFTGCHGRQTRNDALKTCRVSKRQAAIRSMVANAPNGMTRQEIADALDVPVNHITKPVFDLVVTGELVETAQTRLSRWGKHAAVLVSSSRSENPLF
jgi:hypothetical protein